MYNLNTAMYTINIVLLSEMKAGRCIKPKISAQYNPSPEQTQTVFALFYRLSQYIRKWIGQCYSRNKRFDIGKYRATI